MRESWRALLAAAVVAGILIVPVGAAAKSGRTEALTLTGSLTYTWHGDPARGCARDGLCNVSGATIFEPVGFSDVLKEGASTVVPLLGSVTVRERRTAVGTPAVDCLDLNSFALGLAFI